MDMLSFSIIGRSRLILSILDERNEAEQKGERERIAELDQRLELEIQAITAEIKLLRQKEGLEFEKETLCPKMATD